MFYNSLTPARRALLGRIACFRSPVKYEILKALAETAEKSAATLDTGLRDLVARGLLHHDTKEGRFDLHPTVRRYAYDRLAAPDRAAAHTRLRDYFAAVPPADKVTRLEDLAPVMEFFHHTVRAGQFDEACTLFRDRLGTVLHLQLGAYLMQIDLLRALFPDGEDRLPRLRDERAQSWTLNELANSYSLSGQPHRAKPLYEQANAIKEQRNDNVNLANGLAAVAQVAHLRTGALRAAEANLRRRIALCRPIKDELGEAVGHQELGHLLAYRGAYAESETELDAALKIKVCRDSPQGHGINWAYRALRELLLLRSSDSSEFRAAGSALESARRALELADETARTRYPLEQDYVRAHWLLGAAHRDAGQPD